MYLIPEFIDSFILQSKLRVHVAQEILGETLTYQVKFKFLSFMFKIPEVLGPAPLY